MPDNINFSSDNRLHVSNALSMIENLKNIYNIVTKTVYNPMNFTETEIYTVESSLIILENYFKKVNKLI